MGSNTDINDEWKNFEPRKNAPIAAQPSQSAAAPVDINDSQALKELATSALVEIIQKSPRNVSLVAACRELLDRAVGKPLQTQIIEQKNTTTINYTATDRFLESLGIVVDNDKTIG
jgi:hypothetical protein